MRPKRLLVVAAVFLSAVFFSREAWAERKIGILMFSEETRYNEAMNGITDRLREAGFSEPGTRLMTGQLLTFSMGGKPVMKRIALPSVIGNSVNFAMSGSNSDSRITVAKELWQVEADPGQIGQVIQNVVINAREAMPGGGNVEISAGNVDLPAGDHPLLPEGGKFVRIAVGDSGTGISGKHLSRIFEPYYTTKPKGSGLGLATSFSIVRNHGGMIDVKSEAGKGCCNPEAATFPRPPRRLSGCCPM